MLRCKNYPAVHFVDLNNFAIGSHMTMDPLNALPLSICQPFFFFSSMSGSITDHDSHHQSQMDVHLKMPMPRHSTTTAYGDDLSPKQNPNYSNPSEKVNLLKFSGLVVPIPDARRPQS
jgi:hypothetical protein